MSDLSLPAGYESRDLTPAFVEANITDVVALANTIPGSDYCAQDFLNGTRGERKLYARGAHGLAVVQGPQLIGVLDAYERSGEGNQQYPENTLYVGCLAVAEGHRRQGIATTLMKLFFEKSESLGGFLVLPGELNYSLQTNSFDSNKGVVKLYELLDFEERATKQYPDRTDLVLGRPVI